MKTKAFVRIPLLFAMLALLLFLAPSMAHAATPVDTWLEKARATANTADHVIGNSDSGISNDACTIVMPGETIGIYPSASMT